MDTSSQWNQAARPARGRLSLSAGCSGPVRAVVRVSGGPFPRAGDAPLCRWTRVSLSLADGRSGRFCSLAVGTAAKFLHDSAGASCLLGVHRVALPCGAGTGLALPQLSVCTPRFPAARPAPSPWFQPRGRGEHLAPPLPCPAPLSASRPRAGLPCPTLGSGLRIQSGCSGLPRPFVADRGQLVTRCPGAVFLGHN